jgi:hypothetical protein
MEKLAVAERAKRERGKQAPLNVHVNNARIGEI